MDTTFPGLRLSIDNDVAVLHLVGGAYDLGNLDSVAHAVRALEREVAIKAIVLRGDPQTFWIGASAALLGQMMVLPTSDLLGLIARGQQNVTALLTSSKLTVAYIEGLAAGGGVDLALACDMILPSESARVNLFYSKLGVVPDQGGLLLLAERIGWPAAVRFAAESPSWSADDLLALGLTDRKVESTMDAPQLRRTLRKELRLEASTRTALKQARWDAIEADFVRHQQLVAKSMSQLLTLPEQRLLIGRMEAMQRLRA